MQTTSTETTNSTVAQNSIYDEIAPILEEAKKRAEEKEITLEEILGVDRTTIWRWENKLNRKAPRADIVLTLLQFVSEKDTLSEALETFSEFSKVKELMEINFPSRLKSSAKKDKGIYRIEDQYDFYIYYICGTKRGATKDELTFTLGRIAAKKAEIPKPQQSNDLLYSLGQFTSEKIENLVINGVIEQENGYYKQTEQDTYIEIDQGLSRAIQMLNDFIDPEKWSEGYSIFYAYQESIPPEVAKEITRETYQFYSRIKEKMVNNRSNHKSSIPYFISNCAETLEFGQGSAQEVLQ